ncbi:MAG TPA: CDP-glucose 4,6-dehydratase [Candidatus Aquicultor sp.]|jgi:CDP-glucose 4,6-dehydratase
MALSSFYLDKTVLVTGHTGFKGGWLTTWLKQLGAKVIGFALPPEQGRPNLFEAANVAQGMTSILGDIRDLSEFTRVIGRYSPDIVFHLAAQPLVRRSYREPIETYATNIMGTANILEAVRHTPSVRAVVVITSDKCYENREQIWGYREHDPMGGYDPYSSSKGCAELIVKAYRSSFFNAEGRVGVATARAGNVLGGGDWAEDRLVPDIIRALASDEPIIIRHPEAIRPWQHVLEPLHGYLMLGEQLYKKGALFAAGWNFGPSDDDATPVGDIVERMISYWGSGEFIIDKLDNLHEANYLKLDCSKARAKLGWKPELTIDDCLKLTVAWYRAYLKDPASVPDMTTGQINDYMKLTLNDTI